MRVYADENVERELVEGLREAGHDVWFVAEKGGGEADPVHLLRATADRRLLLTLDTDYGRLVFRDGMPAPEGVILCRYEEMPVDRFVPILLELLHGGVDPLRHAVTSIDPDGWRTRGAPSRSRDSG